jgi:hypothetical protein
MAGGTGTFEIDFGAGNESVDVAITGLTAIVATDHAEAFFMREDHSTDHNADEHVLAAMVVKLVCNTPTTGTGFVITAQSFIGELVGKFLGRYVWSS